MTNEQYSRLYRIFEQFKLAQSQNELLKIWHKNRNELFDCRLIIANSNSDPFNLKKVFNHPSLKLQLAGENFWFLNNLSTHYQNLGLLQPILIDPCIVLDTNIVAKINGFLKGKLEDEEISKGILDFLVAKPFFYGFYAIEEYENYLAGQQYDQIKKKLKAAYLFQNINVDKYQVSKGNQIEFAITEGQAESWAENKFKEIFSRSSLPYLNNLKNAIYLLLLKMCEIEFEEKLKYPTPGSKISELYTFMNEVMLRLFGKEIYLISLFFEDHRKENKNLSFFSPIQKSNKNLLKSLKGMATDLTLIQYLERVPDASNRADILVPYLVSRDERLNNLLTLLPKISKLFFYKKEKSENCMSEWENEFSIIQEMRSKPYWKDIEWFYEKPASDARQLRQHEDQKIQKLQFEDKVKELENVVNNYVKA